MSDFTVGLVGCGLISHAHLSAWARTPGFTVAGVLDTNREQAQKRAEEFKIARVLGTLDELVEAGDVVAVCTPPSSHAAIAERAIRSKKHLVMEKPVVTDVADWNRIAPIAREAGVKIAVIHNVKYLSSVQQAKRWVDDGKIGDVIRVRREFLTHPDADRMLSGEKHWSHTLPGGRWFETLPHELYLTHWLAGPLDLSGVTIVASNNAPPGAPADEVVVTLGGERAIASFEFSAHCKENRRTLTVQGTTGRIVVDLLADFAQLSTHPDSKARRVVGRTILDAGSTLLRAGVDRSRYGYRKLRKESPHLHIIQKLGANLRGEGEEPTPFEEIDYVVRMGDQIGREIDRQVKQRANKA